MDVAASEFLMRDSGSGSYDLDFKSANNDGKQVLTGAALGELYKDLSEKYPIVSIEDPFDQDDWENYSAFTAAVGDAVQVVGDDLLVTNVSRIEEASPKEASERREEAHCRDRSGRRGDQSGAPVGRREPGRRGGGVHVQVCGCLLGQAEAHVEVVHYDQREAPPPRALHGHAGGRYCLRLCRSEAPWEARQVQFQRRHHSCGHCACREQRQAQPGLQGEGTGAWQEGRFVANEAAVPARITFSLAQAKNFIQR